MLFNILKTTHYQVLEEKRLREVLKSCEGKKILDVGCGTGKYLRILKQINCQARGVDINQVQVKTLCEEGFDVYEPHNLPQNVQYDVILMAHIIEHMEPHDLVQFFNTYLPMLAKDGQLIIITPTLGARFYYDPTHIRPYYPQSLWMLIGGLETPVAYKANAVMTLTDIYFFKDSWRLRELSAYYPIKNLPATKWHRICTIFARKMCAIVNYFLSFLHYISGGRLGATASWLGVYEFKERN